MNFFSPELQLYSSRGDSRPTSIVRKMAQHHGWGRWVCWEADSWQCHGGRAEARARRDGQLHDHPDQHHAPLHQDPGSLSVFLKEDARLCAQVSGVQVKCFQACCRQTWAGAHWGAKWCEYEWTCVNLFLLWKLICAGWTRNKPNGAASRHIQADKKS